MDPRSDSTNLQEGWSRWWFSNNGSSHLSASSSHASSLRGHIQIASIFLHPASAFSSCRAEKEEYGGEIARRLQGRWASPRRAEPAVGTCLLPRAR